jgi:hypothetical protein
VFNNGWVTIYTGAKYIYGVILSRNRKPITDKTGFAERFPNRRPPDKRTIVRNFKKYESHATSHNRNKGIWVDPEYPDGL